MLELPSKEIQRYCGKPGQGVDLLPMLEASQKRGCVVHWGGWRCLGVAQAATLG